MAKLKVLPELAIIDGFKGKVDFYIYHPTCDPENRGPGIPVARKWPRSPGHLRAQAVMDQWADFTYAASAWNLLSEEIQEAYRALAVGSGLSGRDLFTRSYLSGLYRYEHEVPAPPVEIDIGAAAIDRSTFSPQGYTFISKENPANTTKHVTSVHIYGNNPMSGVKVGIFQMTGVNQFTCRDRVTLGNSAQGFVDHPVDLAAVLDDYIGIYWTGGVLERDNAGEGYWYLHSDEMACVDRVFTFGINRTQSLYGHS